MEVVINYWAVLLAAVAAIVLGSLWFGPLFGKQWMRVIGVAMPGEITRSMKRQMAQSYTLVAIGALVMAFVMAHVLYYAAEVFDAEGAIAGITAAIWMWLGFVATPLLGSVLWENRPWKYWLIVAGYWLVALCAMGAVLAVWE
jgi:hypothetical protein